MLPLTGVAGQLHGGGLQLLSGVLLKDDSPSLNVACVGSAMSISGVVQLLSCVFLNGDCPLLNVACVGSVRSTTWGGVHCCQVSL